MKESLPPIHAIRRQRVMLDSDLAQLYGVPTHRLNQAIKRNADRFPADFRFQLTREEYARLMFQSGTSNAEDDVSQSNEANSSQFVMSSRKHRGATYLPWAFTEHGALMAATVLKSPRAVQMREELQAHATVFKRLAEIDQKLVTHDVILRDVYEKLRPLLNPPAKPAKEMGFHTLLKKRDAEAAVHAEAQRG